MRGRWRARRARYIVELQTSIGGGELLDEGARPKRVFQAEPAPSLLTRTENGYVEAMAGREPEGFTSHSCYVEQRTCQHNWAGTGPDQGARPIRCREHGAASAQVKLIELGR